MKKLCSDLQEVLHNKKYILMLTITLIGCYGFKMVHPAIGIDDTPYEYYFSDGLIAVVGRWVLFLLNKILHIGEYAPFLTDFAGVLLFFAAAILWSVVWKRIFQEKIPDWGYGIFACLFVSNPLISEVFTYFLHNGICIGYVFSALSVLYFMEGIDDSGKGKWKKLGISALFIWVAIGCYESFAVVYLVAVMLVLFSKRLCGCNDKPVVSAAEGVLSLVCAVILRTIMRKLLIFAFDLGNLLDKAELRSVGEMSAWIGSQEGTGNLIMAFKRAFVMYGVFGLHYLPIAVYVCASVIFAAAMIILALKKKDGWLVLYGIAAFIASWILILLEGKVTLYRSCQFLPLFCAFCFLLLLFLLNGIFDKRKAAAYIAVVLFGVLIWNQTADMNKWFYIDYRKYEAAKETMNGIALELEKEHDISKPLVFIGSYQVPMNLIIDAYVPLGDPKAYRMKQLADLAEKGLLEKFYRGNYVWVAQTPALSVVNWGASAFDGNQELVRFMKMHGHFFVPVTDYSIINRIEEENSDMPAWPIRGSIRETEDYLVVNFGF